MSMSELESEFEPFGKQTRDFSRGTPTEEMVDWHGLPIPEELRSAARKEEYTYPQVPAAQNQSPAQMGQHTQPQILLVDFSKVSIGDYVAVMRPHHERPTFEIHQIQGISSSGEVVKVNGMRFRTRDGWRFEAGERLLVRIVQATEEIRAIAGHQHRVEVLNAVRWEQEDSEVVLSAYYAYIKSKRDGGIIESDI